MCERQTQQYLKDVVILCPRAAVMQLQLPTAHIRQSTSQYAMAPGAANQHAAVHIMLDWGSMFSTAMQLPNIPEAHVNHAMPRYGSIASS